MQQNFISNTMIKNDIMIELVDLGEGKYGDYDPNDPDDVELLRFDVSYRNPETPNDPDTWIAFDDASYCTQLPVSLTEEQRIEALKILMGHIYEPAISGSSIKKLCEFLSWISLDSLKTGIIEQRYVLA